MGKRALTKKQQSFVDLYLQNVDMNATECVRKSLYKTKYPDKVANILLGNVRVSEAIRKAQVKREKRTEITQDAVLKEIAKIAFAKLGGSIDLDDEGALTIDKTADKLAALDKLARHLGMYNKDASNTNNVILYLGDKPKIPDNAGVSDEGEDA